MTHSVLTAPARPDHRPDHRPGHRPDHRPDRRSDGGGVRVETASAPAERIAGLTRLVGTRLTGDWAGSSHLTDVCGYAVGAPGKFFRPILLLESAAAVGGEIERVLPAAAGAEGAHVASLMHDDIIDGDLLRRGRPAAHVKFGRDDAIVGGDALIFYLFAALGECGRLGVTSDRIVAAMSKAAQAGNDLCHGQMLEQQIRDTYDTEIGSYLTMIEGKTGALFRASCYIGAVLGGGSLAQADALAEYGTLLGYAFQIVDDLLPLLSTTDTTGKPASSDLANRRPTLPFLLCRAGAEARGDVRGVERLDDLMTADTDIEARWAAFTQMLTESGAVEDAAAMARRYAERAISALEVLDPSPSRDLLAHFAEAAVQRCR